MSSDACGSRSNTGGCVRAQARRTRVAAIVAGFASLGALAAPASLAWALPQQESMPAVPDSPTAQSLLDEARAQAAENPAEAARLARRLLDEYDRRLVRVGSEADEAFGSVGDETERFLRATPAVLDRFRALESRSAEQMLAESGARETARRRRLTRAGLLATVMCAEAQLRADDAGAALAELARLEGHPDRRGRDEVAILHLTASARRRLGLVPEPERDALVRLAGDADPSTAEAARTALAAVDRMPRRAADERLRTPLAVGPAVEAPTSEWREIWALDLDETLFRRLFSETLAVQSPRTYERNRASASWMTVTPVVYGDRIFVHEGHRVRAVDIDSRESVWTRELGGAGLERDVGGVADLNALAVDGGAVVALEGHAFGSSRSGAERVWCLDPATGERRWSVALDSLGRAEDFEGLFPVGTPLLFADEVVLVARKPTQRLEQVDWLIALDRRDGSLRWATLLAGAPGLRMASARRHAGISADAGSVLVGSPLGAVAAVRARDGSFEWLRRFPVPLRELRSPSEPWELGGPVAIEGRVFAIAPDESELAVLDRATGRLIETRPLGVGSQWGAPRYLVATRASDGTPMVLGVGSDLCAFDARDLTRRIWSLAETVSGITPPRTGVDSRAGIRGRVSVAGDTVLVPGVDDLLVLELRSGAVKARIPEQRPANAVLVRDRIVAGGDESLRLLMPPGQAEQILRARLAERPDDPSAAIALFDLAQGTARPTLALEAARAAAAALARGHGGESVRTQLVERLIALAVAHADQGDAIHALALEVASTTRLKVVERLAFGDYLRRAGRAREAVECWRALASDRELGAVLIAGEGLMRAARVEALQRLAQLLSRDVELASALEAEAQRAFESVLAASGTPGLVDIVQRFPRTGAALEAARRLAAAGGGSPAARVPLLAALEDSLVPPARLELVEKMIDELAKAGLDGGDALERVDALLAASARTRTGGPAAPAMRLPRVGITPGEGVESRARLVRYDGLAYLARDPGMILGLQEGALVRLSPSDLAVQWRLRLDDRDPLILWGGSTIVAWQSSGGSVAVRDSVGPGSALMVDASSGAVLFATPRSSDLWKGEVERPIAEFGGMPSAQVLPFCDGSNLVLVRRNGDLASFRVQEPRATPVIRRAVLPQIDAAMLYQGGLVIAGRRAEGQELRGTVLVLDPNTLEARASFEPATGPDVFWAFATALGEVFVGTAGGVERWSQDAAGVLRPTLATVSSDCMAARAPTLLGGALIVIDRSDRPLRVPVFAGAVAPIEVEGVTPSAVQSFRGVVPVPGGALLYWDDRLALVSPAGEVIGVDSTAHERNFVAALPVEGAILQIAGAGGRQIFLPDEGVARMNYAYLVQPLSLAHGLRLEPGGFAIETEKLDRAVAVDGWLLLSSSRGTSAIPLPVARDSGRQGG